MASRAREFLAYCTEWINGVAFGREATGQKSPTRSVSCDRILEQVRMFGD
jgi:hypothetical protein